MRGNHDQVLTPVARQPVFSSHQPQPGLLVIDLGGAWTLHTELPAPAELLAVMDGTIRRIAFSCGQMEDWDTRLLIFLRTVIAAARQQQIEIDCTGLPPGAERLLLLAEAVPEKSTYSETAHDSWVARIGRIAIRFFAQTRELASFTGEIILAFVIPPLRQTPVSGPRFFLFCPGLRRGITADRRPHFGPGGRYPFFCRCSAAADVRSADLRGQPGRHWGWSWRWAH